MPNPDDILITRRTVYKFLDQPVPKEIITKAVTAAAQAPCHKHTHPWKFYVLGEKSKLSLTPVIERLAHKKSQKLGSKNFEQDKQRALSKLINKPLVIVVTSKLTPDDKLREKEDYAATVCALHNLVLSFWSDGIGSQWSTGSITRDLETYSILGIDSGKEEIIGFVKCGYPQDIPQVKKKPVDEIIQFLE